MQNCRLPPCRLSKRRPVCNYSPCSGDSSITVVFVIRQRFRSSSSRSFMLRSPGMCSGTYGFNMALEFQTIRRPRPPASYFSENSCLPSIESFRITISPSSYFRRPSWFRNLQSISAVSCHSTAEISIKEPILVVKDLTAVISETKRPILKGVNLTIYEGEVHAVMGKNGSGKSTFSKVLAGHPDYEVTGGSVVFKGMDMLGTDPEYRSLAGLFTSFQSPVEIPGVTNVDFLNMAYNARRRDRGEPELGPIEFYGYVREKLVSVNMRPEFLNRNVNEGFSGGEKKRNEILQLAVLGAELAILDEIDSGLDVDALRDVANAVKGLFTPKTAALFITHYFRLLECVQPALVHIMDDGKIIRTSDMSVARGLEKEGYRSIIPS